MRLIDLSQPIFDHCPANPNDPAVHSEVISDQAKRGWRVEQLTLTSHTGSHIVAPLHRLPEGSAIDELPLESFVGPAVVADMREARPGQPFTSSWLTRHLRTTLKGHVTILGTGWGQKRDMSVEWLTRGPFLCPDGAHWLAEQEILAVGIDWHSIGGVREPQNTTTHEILFEAGIWIVEDLLIPPELYSMQNPGQFWGLPINLKGHGGAFCRPVLLQDD